MSMRNGGNAGEAIAALVFRHSPLPMVITRLSDRAFVEVNDAFLALIERERDEVIGSSADELGLWVSEAQKAAARDEMARNARVQSVIVDFRKKSGQNCFLSLDASLIEFNGQAYALGILKDVTEEVSLRERLRESGYRLQLAAASGQVGIWEFDVQTGELIWDDVMFALYGARREDFSGAYDAWSTRLHPDDRAATEVALQEAIDGSREYAPDFRVCWANGEVHHLKGHAIVVRDREGRAQRMVGTNWDDSAHAATRRRLHLAYAALDTSKGPCFWFGRDGRLVEVNDAACNDLGYTRDELLQRHAWELEPGLSPGGWQLLWQQLRETGRLTQETRHRRKDGSSFPAELISNYVLSDGDEYSFVQSQDISARKQLETAWQLEFQANKATIEAALSSMSDSVVVFDAAGVPIHFNDAFARFHRFADKDECRRTLVRWTTLFDMYFPDGTLVRPGQRPMARALGGESAANEELNVVRRDSGESWIGNYSFAPVHGPDGGVLGAVVTARDITDSKNAEIELKRSRAAANAASAAKTTFLANMSHEIRTPLNAILGMTYILQRKGGLSGEQLDKLGKISTAADHLLAVINDILDLSKIEVGKLSLEPVELDVAQLVGTATSLMYERAEAKGLRLFTETAAQVPPALVGDPTRISQMLLNYLGNAVKFSERGDIVVRATVEQQTQADLLLRFEVQDEGPGVPEERKASLFTAFEQADNSITRRFGGTGLGLAINRHLARLMGGEADVDPRPGGGSVFWFTARLGRARHKVPAAPDPGAPACPDEDILRRDHAGLRVLVAEDDEVNRVVAEALLAQAGISPQFAGNGQVAVDMARTSPYDLILMDLQMPEMDGIEAARAIRLLPGHRDTPIIALTANAFTRDRSACLEAGMNDHIAKPVEPAVLFRTLLRWLAPRH